MDDYGIAKGKTEKLYDDPDDFFDDVVDLLSIHYPHEPIFNIILETFKPQICPIGLLKDYIDDWLNIESDVRNLGAQAVFGNEPLPQRIREIMREIEGIRNYYHIREMRKKQAEGGNK